jgi:hypothetical protein
MINIAGGISLRSIGEEAEGKWLALIIGAHDQDQG